jgi:ABC-type multidrug transport system permease subunit
MLPIHKIGDFLFIIGAIFLLYFFGTDQSENPQFLLFVSGAVITALGLYLRFRHRPKPEPSERFRLLRKLANRMSKKKD